MKTLSPQAGELVRRLQQSGTFVDRLLGRKLDESQLTALEELKDPYAAPYLVALSLECERTTARRVAAVVRTTMASIPAGRLPQIDEDYRSLWGVTGMDSMPWHSLKPSAIPRLARIIGAESAVFGVTSSHNSGRVREAAVQQLDALSTGEELPYLIVRLNDWVTPVAERARAAVMRRVNPRLATTWVGNLALVHWLTTITRRSHDDVVNAAFDMLRDPASRPALDQALSSPDPRIRRIGYRLARDRQRDDFVDVVRRALEDVDSVVRLEAVRDAREATGIGALTPVFELAEQDPFMPVRREGLMASIERSPSTAMTRATKALLDPNPAMRELARFIVKENQATFPFAEFYRVSLEASRTDAALATAIAGLGETGKAEDASFVIPHLSHRRARVRREAVRALSRLDAESHGATFFAMLSDASPKVTRASRDALMARKGLTSYDAIESAMRSASHLHGRIDALTLAAMLSKWSALRLLLDACRSSQEELAARARELVRRWVATANRRFTSPTMAEVSEIARLLDESVGVLSDDLRVELKSFLEPWVRDNR